jgi:hypothetical protein
MISRRSQIKIQEMIFMVLALVVFFIIIALFYITISLSDIKSVVVKLERTNAITLAARLADSPELSCGKSKCIDTDKLIALINHPRYKDFWDIDGLRIERAFPFDSEIIKCSMGNYPNCNVFMIKESKNTIEDSTFVSLCRKEFKNGYIYDECELGKIIVSTKQ